MPYSNKKKETFTQAAQRLFREKAARVEAADDAEDREYEEYKRKQREAAARAKK